MANPSDEAKDVSNAAITLLPGRLDPVYEARIERIMALGASGEWRQRGRQLTRELSLEWGLAKSTIGHYAGEAWRRLQRETVNDRDLIASELVKSAEKILRDAMAESDSPALVANGEKVFAESPQLSRKVALEAVKTLQALIASNGPVDMSPEWQAMTMDQRTTMLARSRRMLDELTAKHEADLAALGRGTGDHGND
jgi:hypothetical protein